MPEKKRRFSHSLIDTWLQCPRKAEYRYVDNLSGPKGSALVRGSACDKAWNYDLEKKMKTGADIAADDLLQITEQAFRDDVTELGGVDSVNWGKGNARASLDSALRLSREWLSFLAPQIHPTAVQVRYERDLPSGRGFIGFVDCEGTVDDVPVTLDNKTGSRRMPDADAAKSLQPYAYAWLKGEPIDFVFARALDTGRSTNAEMVWTHRSAGDIAWYDTLVSDVERGFDEGIFPTNPTGPFCGPGRCEFYDRCQPHRTVHAAPNTKE